MYQIGAQNFIKIIMGSDNPEQLHRQSHQRGYEQLFQSTPFSTSPNALTVNSANFFAKGMVEEPIKDTLSAAFELKQEVRDVVEQQLNPPAMGKLLVESPLKKAIRDPVDDQAALRMDTERNQTESQFKVHELLVTQPMSQPSAFTRAVYKNILHTDLDDPYLGLAPLVMGGEVGRDAPHNTRK